MKDDWEIKKIINSGSDVWVKLGKRDDDEFEYYAILFCAFILTITFMNVFGITGFWWFVGLILGFLVLGHVFTIPTVLVAVIIFSLFLLKTCVQVIAN